MSVFAVLVFVTAPFVHASRRLTARLFEDFARSEWESRLELMQAAAATDDPARAAQYLRHAEDETRHTRMFARRAGELDARYGGSHRVEAQVAPTGLYARLGEPDFLAFVHHGEARALAELQARHRIVVAAGDGRSAAMLEAVLRDEREHARYTWSLLCTMVGVEGARRRVRHQRLRELPRLVRQRGALLVQPVVTLLLAALYLFFGPLLAWTARARRA